MHQAATAATVLLLHFCSPTPALNALAPHEGITLTQAVAYAAGPRHSLDVYAPRAGDTSAPVIVFFYGGGWQEGSKDWYRFVGGALAKRGMVAVIPDYRLYPEVRFPAFMDDAAQAVAWVRTNAVQFGGDPRRLFLMGHSAGGQIAALLALDPEYLRLVHLSPHDLCGVIGLAGAYDYVPSKLGEFAAIFGGAAEALSSRPINFVTPDAPPMLLLSGLADSVIEPGNTLRLAARLQAAGVPVAVKLYAGITHGALMAAMSDQLAFLAPAREDALRFIESRGSCH
jgi:acetyl esterase/lipase